MRFYTFDDIQKMKQSASNIDSSKIIIDLLNQIEEVQKFASRLLEDISRVWKCTKCGESFVSTIICAEWFVNQEVTIKCQKCEQFSCHPASFIMEDEIERLRGQVKELISKGNEVHDRAAYYGQRSSPFLLRWRDLVKNRESGEVK